MPQPVFNDTGDFASNRVSDVTLIFLQGEHMKKLLTVVCALALSASLALAQAGGGTTSTTGSTDTQTTTTTGKKHHKGHHKGGKKSKKNSGGTTTTPPPK